MEIFFQDIYKVRKYEKKICKKYIKKGCLKNFKNYENNFAKNPFKKGNLKNFKNYK